MFSQPRLGMAEGQCGKGPNSKLNGARIVRRW